MASKSNEAFVFGDIVRTLDGRGPIMLVVDAAPANQLPFMVMCQYWSERGLCEVAVHAGLLEGCSGREAPKPLFERLAPLLTMLVESVDLWAAVKSGRSEVVSVSDDDESTGPAAKVEDDPPYVDEALAAERVVWKDVFGNSTPITVFTEQPLAVREHVLAVALSLVRSDDPERRSCWVEDLNLLLDFALRCGYQLDRDRAVSAFNRVLDERAARRSSGVGLVHSSDMLVESERKLWEASFSRLTPLDVFGGLAAVDSMESVFVRSFADGVSSVNSSRRAALSDMNALIDYAGRFGFPLDRSRCSEALGRILDAKLAGVPSGDVTSHQREVLGKGDSYCGHTCGPACGHT